MINKLLRHCKGIAYVRCTRGAQALLSELIDSNMCVYSVRHEQGATVITMPLRQYKDIRAAVRKTHAKVKLVRRRGVPVALKNDPNILPRAAMVLVFAVCFALLSTRVMAIEISGNSTLMRSEVLETLSLCGVHFGVARDEVDAILARNVLMLEHECLAYASLNVLPGMIKVQLADKTQTPQRQDGVAGSVIISAYDAVITQLDVYSGTALVSCGDTVSRGQLLVIAGQTPAGNSHVANPLARITGYVQQSASVQLGEYANSEFLTGERRNFDYLQIGQYELPLFLGTRGLSGNWRERCYRLPLRLFGIHLPLCVVRWQCSGYSVVTTQITAANALLFAEPLIDELERQNFAGAVIHSRALTLAQQDDGWRVDIAYRCELDITAVISPNM